MKKIITLILISVLLLSISGCKVKPKKEPIYIFYTSDVHCAVNDNVSFPGLKALIEDTRKQHPDVLLVDAGDFLQGGNLGSITKGEAIISLMNDMGYDYVTFGNHEFDYGMEQLKKLLGMADFQFIASNAKYSGSGTSVFEGVPEYCIADFGHTKVAFLGLLTQMSLKTSIPTFFMEDGDYVYDFYSNEDNDAQVRKVQSVVDEVRSQGVDYVIAISHLGSTEDCRPNDSLHLISQTSGIDAFIDGHSHSVIVGDKYVNKEGKDVLITSVGTKLENVGQMIIDTDGTISTVLFSSYDGIDETMKKNVDEAFASQDEILSEKVGETAFELSITDENGIRLCRSREVTVGDLVADSFRVMMDCDIGMVNGGSVRATIDKGEISYGDLLEISPFLNMVVSIKTKGQNILDALEFGAQFTEAIPVFDGNAVGESGSFMQVSGLRYRIDTSKKVQLTFDKNGMLESIAGDRRVHDVEVLKDGEFVPLDPEAYYTVATSDFVAFANGDGNTAFKGCELIKDTKKLIPEIVKEYIREYGVDERYSQLEGRIIVE